jgi:hypothetical protein
MKQATAAWTSVCSIIVGQGKQSFKRRIRPRQATKAGDFAAFFAEKLSRGGCPGRGRRFRRRPRRPRRPTIPPVRQHPIYMVNLDCRLGRFLRRASFARS